MSETVLNSMASHLVDLTLCKTRYDLWDLQWYTESPFWRRTNMKFSREYKIIPDYEIGDMKHGKSLNNILDESRELVNQLELYGSQVENNERDRYNYLLDHARHLNFRTRMLSGERFTFDEMTDGLYCLIAPKTDEKLFSNKLEDLNNAIPGKEPIIDKIEKFRSLITVPRESLLNVLKDTTKFFHDVALKRMNVSGGSMPRVRVRELPNKDMVFLSILFGYDYNHIEYERNFNLLYRWTADKVVEYIGHEMEPGHLTYFEKRLQTMIDTCWPEMSIVSLFSSSNAFTEGSARHAISMSFDNSIQKQIDFERELIFKNAGLDTSLCELMPLWHEFCELSGYGKLEASRNVWDGIWKNEEAAKFLEDNGFVEKGEGITTVKAFADDDGHHVAHDYARDTIRKYFNNYSEDVNKQWELYEQMCCSHMSMKQIHKSVSQIESRID